MLERTGQCVPQVILSAMKYILEEGRSRYVSDCVTLFNTSVANDSVGIFRRSAAKSKLEALKAQCESTSCEL